MKSVHWDLLSVEEREATEKYRGGISSEQAKAQAEEINCEIDFGLSIADEKTWNEHYSVVNPELVGRFGERIFIANKYRQVIKVLVAEELPVRATAIDFGWFWTETEQVSQLVSAMLKQGRIVDVWKTKQFRAVERLTRLDPMPFPAEFDHGLHGTFCKILTMELICRYPLLVGDMKHADERLKKASNKFQSACDELFGIRPEVQRFFRNLPAQFGDPIAMMSDAQLKFTSAAGEMLGILSSQKRFQKSIREQLTGKASEGGRPSNWVAEFIAIQAADIYRTAFSGEIEQSKRGALKPSFHGFLREFAVSYPDAERADLRELARYVWGDGYDGTPFAPI